jgi:cytochrome c-type biogenesis protein CcmH/NrfG
LPLPAGPHPRPPHPEAALGEPAPPVPATLVPGSAASASASADPVASLLDRAETAFQESDHLRAIRLAQQALAERPTARAWMILGKTYRTTWQYKEALDAFDHALNLEPGNHLAREGRRKAAEALAASKTP